MQQELDSIVRNMEGITDESIRNSAHAISKIVIDGYEGDLLNSGLKMAAAIAHFANDYYRFSNEPETTD